MKRTVFLSSLLLVTAATAFTTSTLPIAPPDNYEPNNGFEMAYPLAMGDSVVKNASVFGTVDFGSTLTTVYFTIGPDIDVDIFKVTLAKGTMFTATTFRWHDGMSEDTLTDLWRCRIFICDTLHNIVCGGVPVIEAFQPHYDGVFYIAVTSVPNLGHACRYGLSIAERAILSQQSVEVPDTGLYEDTSGFRMKVNFDTTNLSVDLTLNEKVSGRIDAKMLLPGDFDTAVNTQGAIKTVWIQADQNIASSIKTADIIIPYTPEDISGYSEKSLKVMWLNDTTHQWEPVSSSIDTIKHNITAHTTHFSIYGVFVSANMAVHSVSMNSMSASGMKVDFLPGKRSIAVNFSLPKATNVRMAIYNLQGKCVKKSRNFIAQGNSTSLLDVGTLANGKYFLNITVGDHQVKKSIIVVK